MRLGSILFVLLVMGIGLHFWVGMAQPFNTDEIASIIFARSLSFGELVRSPVEPIHPNGFYIFIKLLSVLGFGDQALRMVMGLVFLSSLYPLWKLLRSWFNQPLAYMGMLFWVGNGYILRFSYPVRMYGVVMALSLWSVYLGWRAYQSKTVRDWHWWIDLIGVFTAVGYWIFLLLKWIWVRWIFGDKRKLIWLVGVGFGGLLLVRLYTFGTSLTHIDQQFSYWMPEPRLVDSIIMLSSLIGVTSSYYYEGLTSTPPNLLVVLVAVGLLGCAGWWLWTAVIPKYRAFVGLVVGLYCLLFLVAWQLVPSLWHIRQLYLFGLTGIILLIYFCLTMFRDRSYFVSGLYVLLLFLSIRGSLLSLKPGYTAYPQRYEPIPEGTLFLSRDDMELWYDYCNARSINEIERSCGAKGAYLLPDMSSAVQSHQQIVFTTRAYEILGSFDSFNCEHISLDYVYCVQAH